MFEWEFNAGKFLKEAEKNIHKAIKDGCSVWITTSDGQQVILDDKCKINYLKIYGGDSLLVKEFGESL